MEIVARRLNDALVGQAIGSISAQGINVLRTFDPPLSCLSPRQ